MLGCTVKQAKNLLVCTVWMDPAIGVSKKRKDKAVIEFCFVKLGYWDSWMQRSSKVRQQQIVKRYGFDNKGKPRSAERMAFSLTGLEQCGFD
eukprot:g67854.t1